MKHHMAAAQLIQALTYVQLGKDREKVQEILTCTDLEMIVQYDLSETDSEHWEL